MKTPLPDRSSIVGFEPDPLMTMLRAEEIRDAYRTVTTDWNYRWVKQKKWWKKSARDLRNRWGNVTKRPARLH